MDKSSTSPTVRLINVLGYENRGNDVVFCGSEGQQHVVFFPGDVQVRRTNFLFYPKCLHRKITRAEVKCYCQKLLCVNCLFVFVYGSILRVYANCLRAFHGDVNIRVFCLVHESLFCVSSSSRITSFAIHLYKLYAAQNLIAKLYDGNRRKLRLHIKGILSFILLI